jgi:ribokinase
MPNQHQSTLILAVGDLVWDVVVKPDSKLLPGGDTTGQVLLSPGGSAANTAAWISRVGGDAGFVGSLGADFFGDAIARDLESEGVKTWLTRTKERDTGVVLVLVDEHGQRSMVTNQGADFALRPEDLPRDVLASASHVHLTAWSLFTDPPRSAALEAARIAQQSGATVSLDPASFQMIQEFGREAFIELFKGLQIDILFPNREEGQALTDQEEPEAIASKLQELFPNTLVVLKLDNEGCYVKSEETGQLCPTHSVQAVDTTGAGDSFNAAFLSSYLASKDAIYAAQTANSIAGWVVARTGARPAIDDELRLLQTSIQTETRKRSV